MKRRLIQRTQNDLAWFGMADIHHLTARSSAMEGDEHERRWVNCLK